MSGWGIALVAVAMAVGLVGIVVPLVPGLGLIWAAGLVYGLVDGLDWAAWLALAVLSTLLLTGSAAKYVLPHQAGAARGASRGTLLAGAAGALLGVFLIPVVGLVVGGVAGVLLAEYRATRDWPAAWRLTKGVLLGFGLGLLAEVAAGVAMVATWVVWTIAG